MWVYVQIVSKGKWLGIFPNGYFKDDTGKKYHTNSIYGYFSLSSSIETKTKIRLNIELENDVFEVKQIL